MREHTLIIECSSRVWTHYRSPQGSPWIMFQWISVGWGPAVSCDQVNCKDVIKLRIKWHLELTKSPWDVSQVGSNFSLFRLARLKDELCWFFWSYQHKWIAELMVVLDKFVDTRSASLFVVWTSPFLCSGSNISSVIRMLPGRCTALDDAIMNDCAALSLFGLVIGVLYHDSGCGTITRIPPEKFTEQQIHNIETNALYLFANTEPKNAHNRACLRNLCTEKSSCSHPSLWNMP